ncbi:hypothetical protein KR51_00004750 [Rubidibacter lacunae KORDI 51-2]|uniref:Glutathione S-transferase n=1 Tax=Rubidibacter lacunae KORDI 51-2 TaxID=582515 RepID=U5DPH8_9CHRO|nr:hypothetical protein [Rubidibacter lacunae]ERN42762.1 hypothetical protein KR51_00004750 [Rubidibacter lacunae KORDI 51-2]
MKFPIAAGLIAACGAFAPAAPVLALPSPDDTPEEVLRAEIIIDARSPLDGRPLGPAEYAELEAALGESLYPPQLDSSVRETVLLLQIRQMLKVFLPLIF